MNEPKQFPKAVKTHAELTSSVSRVMCWGTWGKKKQGAEQLDGLSRASSPSLDREEQFNETWSPGWLTGAYKGAGAVRGTDTRVRENQTSLLMSTLHGDTSQCTGWSDWRRVERFLYSITGMDDHLTFFIYLFFLFKPLNHWMARHEF